MSTCTLKRGLQDAGIQGRVVKKNFISESGWQKKNITMDKRTHWTEEDRNKMLWTDKSKFKMLGSHRTTFVKNRTTERMLEQYLVPSVKQGGRW